MRLITFLVILLLPATSFASLPAFPMAFWGNVTVDGVSAPAGAIVRVYDGSTEVGQVEVESNGVYGYTEPTKQKLVVGESSGVLNFTIQATTINSGIETQGLTTVSHPSFVSGETINKNFAFTIQTPVVNQPSSTGGGGGGGGGKSKSKVYTPVKALVLGISTTSPETITTQTEAEMKIALQKQLILLLTQLISLLQQKMLMVNSI